MLFMVPPSTPALVPFVQVLGYSEVPLGASLERVLPSGGMQLLINLDRDEIVSYAAADTGVVPDQRHSGAVMQGPRDRWSVIDTASQRSIAWVSFRPGGAYPFFGGSSAEARGLLVELDALWGHDAVRLRERLLDAPDVATRLAILEQELLAHAYRPLTPDPRIQYAVAALGRGVTVGDVVDRTGMAARGFGRLFTDHVGLTPKRFARVRRFQRLLESVAEANGHTPGAVLNGHTPGVVAGSVVTGATAGGGTPGTVAGGEVPGNLATLGDAVATIHGEVQVAMSHSSVRADPMTRRTDWASLAVHAGYFDQAHMIHEFAEFAGLTPTAYQPRSMTELNHVPIEVPATSAGRTARGKDTSARYR